MKGVLSTYYFFLQLRIYNRRARIRRKKREIEREKVGISSSKVFRQCQPSSLRVFPHIPFISQTKNKVLSFSTNNITFAQYISRDMK